MKLRHRINGEMVDIDIPEDILATLAGHNLRSRWFLANIVRGWTDRKRHPREVTNAEVIDWVSELLTENPWGVPS